MPWNIQSDFICKEIENNLRDYHYHIENAELLFNSKSKLLTSNEKKTKSQNSKKKK